MNKKAFTLIELLISLGLLSLVMSSCFLLLGTQVKTYQKCRSSLAEKQIALRIFNLVGKELRNAETITLVSTNEIFLKVKDQNIIYGVQDVKIKRKSGEQTAYLTNPGEVLTFELLNLTIGNLTQNVCLRNSN
jgi:prepilin-type N-terminal cleavage/methylation domain-containing protein